jgi:O-antigen/teichoic acid export membrane protein
MLAKSSRALATLFITRVSGPSVFGLFSLATSVAELATRFTVFGMDKALLKFVAEGRASGTPVEYPVLSVVIRTGAFLSIGATILLIVVAPWVATSWLNAPELVRPVRLVALAIIPLTLATLLLAATKALKIMRYDALVSGLVTPLALFGLAVPILWTDDDVTTLAVAFALSAVVALVFALGFFGRHFRARPALTTRPGPWTRGVLRFSTPLGLHDFVQLLAAKLELFLLLFFVGPAQLGVYALASEIAFVMKKVRQSFDPILIPVIAEVGTMDQDGRAWGEVARVLRWILMICVPFVGTMGLFGPQMMALFGPGFTTGALTLSLLCGAQLLNAATGLFDLSMMVSGRTHINLFNVCALLVVQTVLNFLWIPRFGIVGGAAAALGAFLFLALLRVAQGRVILGLRPFDRSQLKPVLAGGLAAVPIPLMGRSDLLTGIWWTAPTVVAYLLTYVLLMRAFGLTLEDRELIRAVRGRFVRRS